jgi:hypothetical protein
MKDFKKLGVAVLAAAAVGCLGATPASATTLDGGAFTLSATNWTWAFHNGLAVSCINSTMSGTTPAGTATTVSVPVTFAMSGCNFSGVNMFVSPNEGCHTPATSPRLDIMRNQAAAPQASVQITLPVGCNIDLAIPAFGCTMSITGGQTIGNGTTGAGGINWTNQAPHSVAHVTQALIPTIDSNGMGILCPPAGTGSATASATFTVTSATNVTVTP